MSNVTQERQRIRVFLSSPGDVHEERELARVLIKDELSVDPFLRDCFTFEVVSWDDPAGPTPMTAGLTPQEAVLQFGERPSECDFVVVVLWKRIGTLLDVTRLGEKPSGGAYLSGTEWEFEDALRAWTERKRPQILVYRRIEQLKHDLTDPAEAERTKQSPLVEQFFSRFENPDGSLRGGWTKYENPYGFKDRLGKDLRRMLRQRLDVQHLESQKGVPAAALRAVLARFGEHKPVAEHEIPDRLARWAEEFVHVQGQLGRSGSERPESVDARQRASDLLHRGGLDEAQAVLEAARQKLRRTREQTAREEAALLADEAGIQRLRLDYAAAANALLEASALLRVFDTAQAWRYTYDAGAALTAQGYEFGDHAALERAVELFKDALTLANKDERPKDWAETQYGLAGALQVLGMRESGTERLEQGAAALYGALQVRTRRADRLNWASTQCALGNILRLIGEREPGTARLEEAVAAQRAAVQAYTRNQEPFAWAIAQGSLGAVLRHLGTRELGTARLQEAVTVLQEALQASPRERYPLLWAWAQCALGEALRLLGERELGTERLQEAVIAFRAALEEYTRDRVPLHWAATQTNLGNALRLLGERSLGVARLEDSVGALRAALSVRTRDRDPLGWAVTQGCLGEALRALGERSTGTKRLEESVFVLQETLPLRTPEIEPLGWAWTQSAIGEALRLLGERESNTARLEVAVELFRQVSETRSEERDPIGWALTQASLGAALRTLGESEPNCARLQESVTTLSNALTTLERAGALHYAQVVRDRYHAASAQLKARLQLAGIKDDLKGQDNPAKS